MKIVLRLVCTALISVNLMAQGYSIDNVGVISGSVQTDIQTYQEDSLIGAPKVAEQMLSITFVNILFNKGKFSAGVRFESYQNPLLGIDPRY